MGEVVCVVGKTVSDMVCCSHANLLVRALTGSSHVRVWEVSEWAGVQVVAWAACSSCHQ